MKKYVLCFCLALLVAGNVWAKPAAEVHVDVLAKTGQSWDGTDLRPYAQGKPEVTILRIEVPPNVRLPLHKHPVINAGVLLKGELTVVTQNGETLHLQAGDAIVEVVDKWHYGINEGSGPAEIIVFYAGVEGGAISEKQEK